MSTFAVYNTDDPNAPAGTYPALGANGTVTIGPVLTGVSSKVAGSFFSDTTGTLLIQQSFDYFSQDNQVNPTPHFDIVQFALGSTAGATTGGTSYTIDLDVLAPVLQVTFTNGATPQVHMRLFVRVFGLNRG